MSIAQIVAKFSEVTADPYGALVKWKQQSGKKVIGCFPMHIPEEIVHAAGALPVVMWEGNEPVTLGYAHIAPYNCGIIKSVIDDAVRGKLNFLDGMICYDTCLQAKVLLFVFRKHTKIAYLERFYLPGVITNKSAKSYMVESLTRLKASLEKFTGREINNDKLNQSIRIYNENRDMLRKLYDFRRKNPGLLAAKDIVDIVHSSMLMLKEDHNKLMRELLQELEKAQATTSNNKAKIILSGSLCMAPHSDILDLIEEAGMTVVDDDLYTGSRYFANNVKVGDRPLEALADRYLTRTPPCATKIDSEMDWSDYLIEMVNKAGAKGVISFVIKYCPPHVAYYPDIAKKLGDTGIATLMIEAEHEVVSLAQVKTRFEAFKESIEEAL